MSKQPCWKRMSSGKYVDLNNLTEDMIDLGDINMSLNHIYRFTGHHKNRAPLTVAQHSKLCLMLAQTMHPNDTELHKAVLSHDFAEAYIGDVATPVKRAMGDRWYQFAKPLEALVERAVMGYNFDQDMHDQVKIFDLMALDIERRSMWDSQVGMDKWPVVNSQHTLESKRALFRKVARRAVNLELEWGKLLND